MEYNKKDFIRLVKSMPDNTTFNMKLHWEDKGDKLVQYAHFESDYKLGCVDTIRFE